MKDVTPKETRDERISRMLTNNATAMETIFNHVAQGGTLVELAKTWDIPYWSVAGYTSIEGRDKILQRAMILRSEYWIEELKGLVKDLTQTNIKDFFNPDGTLMRIDEMPDAKAAAIAQLEIVEYFEGEGKEKMQVGFTKKIKFWDKSKSIDQLAKFLGAFVEKVEHTHTLKLEDLVGASQDVTPIDVDKSNTDKEI